MYMVEKIGQLILITLEGHINDQDACVIRKKLEDIVNKEDEVVVSLNLSSLKNHTPTEIKLVYTSQQKIIDFCNQANIHIYSYNYK